MPYVQRDRSGNMRGLFARRQEGFAEEFLAEDHPDVVAFLAPTVVSDPDRAESRIQSNPALLAMVRRMARIEGKTERQILDELRAEV